MPPGKAERMWQRIVKVRIRPDAVKHQLHGLVQNVGAEDRDREESGLAAAILPSQTEEHHGSEAPEEPAAAELCDPPEKKGEDRVGGVMDGVADRAIERGNAAAEHCDGEPYED